MSGASDPAKSSGGGRHRLSRRRAQHSQSVEYKGPAGKIPHHPLIIRDAPELIADDAAFRHLIDDARAAGRVAYDTEFIGELSYYPQLCVVQIATPTRLAVVDTLAGIDLEPLWRLLADASVRKVVHAGSQDLEPVYRHLGVTAANVWDTQILAGFAALPYPLSLSKLVGELIGVKLGKGLTFTSWDERPISEAHVRYAADDVRYLLATLEALDARLAETGHAAWAMDECVAACDPDQFRFDPQEQAVRMRGARGLSPKQLSVLGELLALRDEGARERDMPPRAFLKDEVLLDLARNHPKKIEQLAAVRGMPRPVVENYGQRLVDAIHLGATRPASERPVGDPVVEDGPLDRVRGESMWVALQAWCFARAIDPALLANRHEIGLLTASIAAGSKLTPPARLTSGWRGAMLDEFFHDFVAGRRSLELRWTDRGLAPGDA